MKSVSGGRSGAVRRRRAGDGIPLVVIGPHAQQHRHHGADLAAFGLDAARVGNLLLEVRFLFGLVRLDARQLAAKVVLVFVILLVAGGAQQQSQRLAIAIKHHGPAVILTEREKRLGALPSPRSNRLARGLHRGDGRRVPGSS